jgi:hypothetical protein
MRKQIAHGLAKGFFLLKQKFNIDFDFWTIVKILVIVFIIAIIVISLSEYLSSKSDKNNEN